MRWLVAAALLRHGAPSPPCWVRITHPADGADVALDGGWLPLGFRVGGAVDGLDVCVQLTNKRVSYESFTHCGAASAREFVLSGFLPGVWRAKAYLAASPGPAGLRRGAAPDGDCGGHESWFLADREAWERDVGLSAAPGGNGTRARRVRDRLLAAEASAPSSGAAEAAGPRVLGARRSRCPEVFVFALSGAAARALAAHGVASAALPVEDEAEIAARRDVQSRGFGGIAILKPVAVLAVLEAGLDAWPAGSTPATSCAVWNSNLQPDFNVARGEAHFHVEACTGVYLARRGARGLLEAAVQTLAHVREALCVTMSVEGTQHIINIVGDFRPDDVWFGDQAATNTALFEARFRGETRRRPPVAAVLDPLVVPGGGLFFDGPLGGGPDDTARVDPRTRQVLAHNNFVVGEAAKLARFRRRGFWFAEDQPAAFARALADAPPPGVCAAATVRVDGVAPRLGARAAAAEGPSARRSRTRACGPRPRPRGPWTSRARYGVERPGDGRWFNSGVVVASWAHASLVARLPAVPLDRALHWDQGFLNAMRVAYEAPLADLGYAFNYVGSFLTANAASRPFESPADAFFVHGTTGLLLPPAERAAFLANVSDAWPRGAQPRDSRFRVEEREV
ncbi:hypothetical protein JL720_1696 [Aureococcus anophagefferens]|nr:hypothetical protein JL720_1696 [Aureococcus anophagefferens]